MTLPRPLSALLFALLLVLAFPFRAGDTRFDVGIALGWLALVPFVWMLRGLTPRRAFVWGSVAGTAAFCGVFLAAAGSASAAQVRVLSDATRHAGEFIIPVNKSQVLRLDVPLADLLVGNPEIADVLALTDRSIYVLGKSIGSTSLTLYGQGKTLIAVLDLVVSQDVEGLKARLFELMPEEKIEVRPVNGSRLAMSA